MKYNKSLRRKAIKETYTKDYSSQESEEYISKGKKRARQRQENSLGELTKSFINYVRDSGTNTININDLVKKLKVKKRRIYDITNVLEGIGYIKKHAKNEISWLRTEMLCEESNSRLNHSQTVHNQSLQNKSGKNQLMLIKELEAQNKQLDASITKLKSKFVDISSNEEFSQYGYVTFDDLKLLTASEKINLLAIKAPKGTSLEIINPEETKNAYLKTQSDMENGVIKRDDALLESLKKEHHLFFDSPNGEILVYVAMNESDKRAQSEFYKNAGSFNYHHREKQHELQSEGGNGDGEEDEDNGLSEVKNLQSSSYDSSSEHEMS